MFASKPLLLFRLRRRTPASVLTFSKERSSLVGCLIWRRLPSCSRRWRSSPLEWLTWAVRWTGAPRWSLVPILGGHVPVQPPSPCKRGRLHLGSPSWGRKRLHPQWWWKSLRLISLFVFQYYLFAKSDLDLSIELFVFVPVNCTYCISLTFCLLFRTFDVHFPYFVVLFSYFFVTSSVLFPFFPIFFAKLKIFFLKNQKFKKKIVAHAIQREHFLVTMFKKINCYR